MELHQVRFYEKTGLAGTGAANHQHIFIPGKSRIFGPAGHHQPLRLGQDDVVFRLGVHKRSNIRLRAPAGAPVFHILPVLFGIFTFHIDHQANHCGADQPAVAQIDETSYYSLDEAVENAEDGATIGSRVIDVCLVGIQSVDFHGGPRGSRPDSFGMYVPKDAERLVPRMSLIVNKDIEFRFKVCIGFPKDKAAKDVDEYDIQYEYTASLRSSPGKVVHLLLPASDVHFNRKGPGVLHIFDMNGSCLAAGLFYVNE